MRTVRTTRRDFLKQGAAGAALVAGGHVLNAVAQTSDRAPADLLLTNGRFATLWREKPAAQAVAIREGRFAAVGTEEEVRRLAGPSTKTIDLGGRTAIPGL